MIQSGFFSMFRVVCFIMGSVDFIRSCIYFLVFWVFSFRVVIDVDIYTFLQGMFIIMFIYRIDIKVVLCI